MYVGNYQKNHILRMKKMSQAEYGKELLSIGKMDIQSDLKEILEVCLMLERRFGRPMSYEDMKKWVLENNKT